MTKFPLPHKDMRHPAFGDCDRPSDVVRAIVDQPGPSGVAFPRVVIRERCRVCGFTLERR